MSLMGVALGGALGAVCRVLVTRICSGLQAYCITTCINVLGCFLIGALYARTEDAQVRLVLGAGLLGGFTTFSSFGRETLELLAEGRLAEAAGSVLLSVGLGLGAVWLGQRV